MFLLNASLLSCPASGPAPACCALNRSTPAQSTGQHWPTHTYKLILNYITLSYCFMQLAAPSFWATFAGRAPPQTPRPLLTPSCCRSFAAAAAVLIPTKPPSSRLLSHLPPPTAQRCRCREGPAVRCRAPLLPQGAQPRRRHPPACGGPGWPAGRGPTAGQCRRQGGRD